MDCVQISDKFKDCLPPSANAFTADLCFSYLHINRTLKAVDVFTAGIFVFHFFYPKVKNLKLCPFVTNDPHNCRISVLIIYFPKQMLS